jgi:hypothetical protein
MTYNELLDLVEVYLGGDYQLPESDNAKLVALKSAYYYAADNCTALKLLTTNKDNAIMRMGPGSTYVRMPSMPVDGTDKLDIDSELVPAIARVIAHYVAKDIKMKAYHETKALEAFRRYESKVTEYLNEMNARGEWE